MTTSQGSLGDVLVDRTESLDGCLIEKYFIDKHDDKIKRLLDSEQYLLEGSRGVGKTMLMKTASIRASKDFEKDSVLAVWISFEESLRIERIKIINDSIDPFLQWTMGKILHESLKILIELKPTCVDSLGIKLSQIFGTTSKHNYDEYVRILEEYIHFLEKAEVETNEELETHLPSSKLAKILDNPTSFKEFLLNLISDFNLQRVVFLFDEAAHVFSYSQQEKFFTFFKSLRHPKIACKAAIYPGITNFGKYFEKGQDAKEISIAWDPTKQQDIDYIKRILKVRIQSYNTDYWASLTNDSNIIETICVCSNGNPRFAFHIIDDMDSLNCFAKKIYLQNVINSVRRVFANKWKEFNTLQKRLPKYTEYIEGAEFLIKNTIVVKLKEWNEKQRKAGKKMSIGYFISTFAYDAIPQVFDILAYSNIVLIDYSKKNLGHSKQGYYMSVNPSLLFSDSIIKTVVEIKNSSMLMENNQTYSETTPSLKKLIDMVKVESEYKCIKCSFKTNDGTFKFCPKCGNAMKQDETESLYKILRSHDIDNLPISARLITRLKEKFNTIGDLYDTDIEMIRMRYIQDVRIKQIKTAAIEYMAG
jgi:Cdc6-like AAA superfamily ATPase